MSFLGNIFGRKSSPASTAISEKEILDDIPESPPELLAAAIRELLDKILTLFEPGDEIIAEVLIPSRDGSQLITKEIRPLDASLLYARIRAGQSLSWTAFATGVYLLRDEIAPQSAAAMAQVATPVLTRRITSRSALSYPLMRADTCLGVLNLESPHAGALSAQALTKLTQSGLLQELAAELAKIRLEDIPGDEVATRLIECLRERIPYVISPSDMTEAYYQILTVAVSVVRPVAASAGLILVYNQGQELTGSGQGGTLYAVRASRFGAFNSLLEWDLEENSLARGVIQRRRGEFFEDAHEAEGYRDSGTGEQRTGEVIVPLMDNKDRDVAGVIGLVTPYADNFAGQDDVARVQAVASISVDAIRRSEQYKLGRRRALQQTCARDLQDVLAPLFPGEMRSLTGETIKRVRKQVGDKILDWARVYTNSQHGAFVLIQTTPSSQQKTPITELVMADMQTNGDINRAVASRWLPGEGVSGRAYTQRKTIRVADVYAGDTSHQYIPYFLKAKSEVATPLQIGGVAFGVLDVEADEEGHFTSDYVDWIEFLARQAAFALSVIEQASKTRLELAMSDLSSAVDQGIADMREDTLPSTGIPPRDRVEIIRRYRAALIEQIVERMRELTGAWVGRFLIELNAYDANDKIDLKHGSLYYMYSSDPEETTDPERRFFPLGDGVSSAALISKKPIIFNDKRARPDDYFDSNVARDSHSGIFVPTLEGTHVSGVLNIECAEDGVFTPELIRACESAGDLISKLLTGTRLRIASILREILRTFELEIAREQSSQLTTFMTLALGYAAQLSFIEAGWGTIIQLQSSAGDSALHEERRFWKDFADKDSPAVLRETAHAEMRYPVFRHAIESKLPIVILDRQKQDATERLDDPWPAEARSVIAVPLISPAQGGSGKQVIGLLAMAHPSAAEFSEYDKESLSMYAESIVSGQRTIALKQARLLLVEQLRLYIAKAIFPAYQYADTADDALKQAQTAWSIEQARPFIASARDSIPRSMELLQLAGNLTGWFLDLSDDELTPDGEDPSAETVQSVLDDFRGPADTFASIFDKSIAWNVPDGPALSLAPGAAVAQLINAVMFQYLDAAFRIGPGDVVEAGASASGADAIFWVKCDGEPLSRGQQEAMFSLSVVGTGRNSLRRSSSRALQGMFQVAQIAQRLNGRAYYIPDRSGPMANCFYLAIPLAGPVGER